MKITKQNVQDIFRSKLCSVETMELKGYKFIENLFVDSSGLGQEDEPAMTQSQFMKRINELLNEYGTIYTAISGAGMFQVNLAVYTKSKDKRSKVIANNTLEIMKDNKRIIRLYDTDIVTFQDNTIKLDTGGYNTMTTRRRMNEVLPSFMRVFVDNGVNFCKHGNNVTKFDGDTLTITY